MVRICLQVDGTMALVLIYILQFQPARDFFLIRNIVEDNINAERWFVFDGKHSPKIHDHSCLVNVSLK